jgi:hypothetical protein
MKLRQMGTYGVQIKEVHPWLVRWARCASFFYPVLASLVGSVQNIFFFAAHFFTLFVPIAQQPANRGLQCFKLNGNQTENDRYWQKNNFLLFAKCLKMYSYFRICI